MSYYSSFADLPLPSHGSCEYCSLLTSHFFFFSFSYLQGAAGKGHFHYSITTQLLILYYILSYEEALLANSKALGLYIAKTFACLYFLYLFTDILLQGSRLLFFYFFFLESSQNFVSAVLFLYVNLDKCQKCKCSLYCLIYFSVKY